MENDVNMESHQVVTLNFPRRVFDNPETDFQIASFKGGNLSPDLDNLEALNLAGGLNVITLNSKFNQTISSPGLATPFTLTHPSSTQILADFNSAKHASKLQIFFMGKRERHVYNKLKDISVQQEPPFNEYSWAIGTYGYAALPKQAEDYANSQ